MPYHRVARFVFQSYIYYTCVVLGFVFITGHLQVLTHLIT